MRKEKYTLDGRKLTSDLASSCFIGIVEGKVKFNEFLKGGGSK